MIKKYIQLLLSINFCLTATGIANPNDEDDRPSFVFFNSENDNEVGPEYVEIPLTETKLSEQFDQIWQSLDKINKIYRYESLQNLIDQHESAGPFHYEDEEITEIHLSYQLEQIGAFLKNTKEQAGYQQTQTISEQDKSELNDQFEIIMGCFREITTFYPFEILSKRDKAFLSNQLEELTTFSEYFMSETKIDFHIRGASPAFADHFASEDHENPAALDQINNIQGLLESCQEEDSQIYAQYEPVINSEEFSKKELLADSKKAVNTFLYFNKKEGLMEIKHQIENNEPYTTVWKISLANRNSVENWNINIDQITITETSIVSFLSAYLENLHYYLYNETTKNSVRANFVCKSTYRNTYTILDIDYHKNAIILENGFCLFVDRGSLEKWHAKDPVILIKSGASLSNSYKLINKRNSQEIQVSI